MLMFADVTMLKLVLGQYSGDENPLQSFSSQWLLFQDEFTKKKISVKN